MRFEINLYDECITNKMIDGKQCTICWYVDVNKVSYADPKVVESVVKEIQKEFNVKLVIESGKKVTYLGMDLEFMDDGAIEISMPQHNTEIKWNCVITSYEAII